MGGRTVLEGLLPAEGCRQRKGNFSQNLALLSNLPQKLFEDPPHSKQGGIHAKSAAGCTEPLLLMFCIPKSPSPRSQRLSFLLFTPTVRRNSALSLNNKKEKCHFQSADTENSSDELGNGGYECQPTSPQPQVLR